LVATVGNPAARAGGNLAVFELGLAGHNYLVTVDYSQVAKTGLVYPTDINLAPVAIRKDRAWLEQGLRLIENRSLQYRVGLAIGDRHPSFAGYEAKEGQKQSQVKQRDEHSDAGDSGSQQNLKLGILSHPGKGQEQGKQIGNGKAAY
jgi:hypothetical protein